MHSVESPAPARLLAAMKGLPAVFLKMMILMMILMLMMTLENENNAGIDTKNMVMINER